MNITITVNAGPETLAAINRLADALGGQKTETPVANPLKSVPAKEKTPAPPAAAQKITVEMIREVVASKQATKKAELKALLAEFNAANVTSLDPTKYEEFYTAALAV